MGGLRTVALVALLAVGGCARAESSAWSDWDRFADRFLEADGRVVDLTFDQKSTSEGQSYGLFFALVANDRARFDTILRWTSNNLANGKLGDRLPAWLWGKRDDGSWGVKDDNAASDGELWIAYSLLQAARLWNEPKYEALARKLMDQIAKHDVARADSTHAWLLPGPVGFVLDENRLRIDPSYLPQFIFEAFADADASGPWEMIWKTYMEAAPKIYASGIAPDLFIVDAWGHITPDPDRSVGSYDAIRVYLWAGMSGPRGEPLLRQLGRFAEIVRARGRPPEKVDSASGALYGDFSPIGFSGAVLPYLQALGEQDALKKQTMRLKLSQLAATAGASSAYYDQALILFGKGWLDGAYRFDDNGRLVPRWAR